MNISNTQYRSTDYWAVNDPGGIKVHEKRYLAFWIKIVFKFVFSIWFRFCNTSIQHFFNTNWLSSSKTIVILKKKAQDMNLRMLLLVTRTSSYWYFFFHFWTFLWKKVLYMCTRLNEMKKKKQRSKTNKQK